MQVKVFLAGRVGLEADGIVVDEGRFPGRQSRLLFAYLVAEQGRAVPRDELAEAVWHDSPPTTWDKALTGVVSRLRGLLTDDLGLDGASILTGAFGCYRLELPEGSWVDVVIAADAARDAEASLAAGELAEARAAAALAESLTRQPFLPGEEGEWVEGKRRELVDVRGRALTALANESLLSGDPREAANWAEQAIALAPFRETGYVRLMEAHTLAGNRAEALQVYERCRRLLAEELGAYPSPETESMYRALLEAPSASPGGATATSEEPPGAPAPPTPSRRRGVVAISGVLAAITVALVVAFVSLQNDGDAAPIVVPNSLVKIDVGTNEIVDVVGLGGEPGEVEILGDYVFVASRGEGTLSRFDTRTRDLTTSGRYRTSGALDLQGTTWLWVASGESGQVLRVEPESLLSIRSVQLPFLTNWNVPIAVGGGSLWETSNNSVRRWQLGTLRLQREYPIELTDFPLELVFGHAAAWLGLGTSNELLRIGASSGRARRIPVGSQPTGQAVGFGSVWSAMLGDDTVWRVNPRTGKVRGIVEVGDKPMGVAVGAGSVWVTNHCDGTISRIDPRRNTIIETVETGYHPKWLVVGDGFVWVGVSGKVVEDEICPESP